MITNLSLTNFILVKLASLDFCADFNVLTGETGVGKSVIAGAVSTVFGDSYSKGILLDNSMPGKIEVTFSLDLTSKELAELLKKNDVESEENELYISREFFVTGKSKSFINGRRVSVSTVREFKDVLIDFHSQREQLKLFDTEYQLELLDKFGNLTKQRTAFSAKFVEFKHKQKELEILKKQESDTKEKIQLYRFQLEELEDKACKPGEDDELQNELNLLTHSEEILITANELEHEIYESENSVYDTIRKYSSALSKFENDNDKIKQASDYLQSSLSFLDDSVSAVREVQSMIEVDDQRLEEVETRFDEVNKLKLKYKMNLHELIEYKNKIALEISNYSSSVKQIELAEIFVKETGIKLINAAKKLSDSRKKAAVKFEKEIEENLKQLAIPEAKVKLLFNDFDLPGNLNIINEFTFTGADRTDIYFSGNIGKDVQPLRMVASGGEISRFLLVIKKILSDKLSRKTIIFDEIDSGIGGKTSKVLGKYIKEISNFHQIICISHLAQIAALANKHFAIDKKTINKFSVILINELDEKAKKNEIARMLSGSDSELALKYAEEIIKDK
jgi:DNA repair protein RecN (Recombination protein N)